MSVKILDQKKNPLLKREEVHALFEHAGKPTPPREEILPSLEKTLRAKKDLILIDKIFSIKGKGESKLKVFVYSKKEDIPKDKLELIQKRVNKKIAKKEGAKPAEPPKEEGGEAKPEEKKEGEEKPEEGKEKAKPEEVEKK